MGVSTSWGSYFCGPCNFSYNRSYHFGSILGALDLWKLPYLHLACLKAVDAVVHKLAARTAPQMVVGAIPQAEGHKLAAGKTYVAIGDSVSTMIPGIGYLSTAICEPIRHPQGDLGESILVKSLKKGGRTPGSAEKSHKSGQGAPRDICVFFKDRIRRYHCA